MAGLLLAGPVPRAFGGADAAGVRSAKPAAPTNAPVPSVRAEQPAAGAAPATERDGIEQWVQTRSLIGKERQDWRIGREVINERIDLLRREIEGLQEKTAQGTNATATADATLVDLRTEQARLRETAAELQRSAIDIETAVRRWLPLIPDPVRERVKPLSVRMPADSMNTKIPLAERLQLIVGILNEVTKANGEIVQAVEVRAMPDGKSAELRTVYVGLAEAYYVSARGDAGIGRADTNGWKWTAASELAEPVRAVLDILQNKGSPRFVALPAEVK
jgi:FtsZ-binding cell division protein ZapB